jgi:hypothetical protein
MGSAFQDRKTPEGDEKNRKNILETYSTIFSCPEQLNR